MRVRVVQLPLFSDELLPVLWFQSTHMVSLCPFGELCLRRLQVILKFGIDLGLGTDTCDILLAEKIEEQSLVATCCDSSLGCLTI